MPDVRDALLERLDCTPRAEAAFGLLRLAQVLEKVLSLQREMQQAAADASMLADVATEAGVP